VLHTRVYDAKCRTGGGENYYTPPKPLPPRPLYSRHYYIVYVIKSLPPNAQPQLLAAIFHGDRCRYSAVTGTHESVRARNKPLPVISGGVVRRNRRKRIISAGSSAAGPGGWKYKNEKRSAPHL